MSLRLWTSVDNGDTWAFASVIVATTTNFGLWEPEFTVDSAGRLVCFFSDETLPQLHSQFLAQTYTTDLRSWSAAVPTVAASEQALRPGMANVRYASTTPRQ